MGKKNVFQTKTNIEYKVSDGPQKGWVSLTARITSQSGSNRDGNDGQMDLTKIQFTSDMHDSGEIRNIQYSGSALPSMGDDAGEIPKEMAAMYEQSSNMIADAWKNAIFWFPELPENAIKPGDEFEVTHKMGTGGEGIGMSMKSVSKQVFTLEDVNEGLAYFSVKERTITKSTAAQGGKTDSKTAGKGEAIFDLREGMWIDMTLKSQSKVQLGHIPGMSDTDQELFQITKFHMEKK
jgi:hypothetical protein